MTEVLNQSNKQAILLKEDFERKFVQVIELAKESIPSLLGNLSTGQMFFAFCSMF